MLCQEDPSKVAGGSRHHWRSYWSSIGACGKFIWDLEGPPVGTLMEKTAAASHCPLFGERVLTLISIFCQGPAAIQRAVAQQTILPAEVDGILRIISEDAHYFTHEALGFS